MMAPQSAMHSMSVNLGAPNEQIFIGESENDDPTKDVIARGIITEEQARGIYERYVRSLGREIMLNDDQIYEWKQEFPAPFRPCEGHL
jgi:hypothetical protein